MSAALGAQAVNNAKDWVSVFAALFPGNRPQTLKVSVPETIILATTGFPVVWYYTNPKGLLRKKSGQATTVRMICQHWQQLYPGDGAELAGVEHVGFTSRVLSRDAFVARMESLCTTAADEDLIPFCVQQFIPPRSNLRYVTTYMRAEYSVTCETFPMAYDRRYAFPPGVDVELAAAAAVSAATAGRPGSPSAAAAATASAAEGAGRLSAPAQEAAMLNMKRLTTSIVNSINRDSSRSQLDGLVLEFVVGAVDGKVYLTGVLGTSWTGKQPSWEELAEHHPDVALIRSAVERKGRKKKPGSNNATAREPSAPRPGKPSPRAGAGVVPQGGGHGNDVHRLCRPPLVVELARQLEAYKEALTVQTEAHLEARDVGRATERRAASLASDKAALEADIAELQKQVAELSEGREEREADLTSRLMSAESSFKALQATHKQLLETRNELQTTLDRERSVTFGLLGEFQTKVAHLETTVQAQTEELTKLREERKLMRQSSIAKNMMGGSSNDAQLVEQLREQLKLAQVTQHELRLKCDTLKQDNEKLLRLLPLSTQRQVQPDKRATRAARAMHLDDVVSAQASPETERDLVRQAMLAHMAQLQAIFKHYSTPGEQLASRRRAMQHEDVVRFARDCQLLDRQLTVAQIDILARQVVTGQEGEGHHGSPLLTLSEFLELVVRIASVRYRDQQYVADQVTALLENDVLPNAKMGPRH